MTSELENTPTTVHAKKKKRIAELFSHGFLKFYFINLFYFMLSELVDLGGDLFLTENGQLTLLTGLKIFVTLALAVLPMIIVRLNSIIGNVRLIRIAFIILTISSLLLFVGDPFIYVFLFIVPFISRFFNSGLNPYLIKTIKQNNNLKNEISKVYAIRDFFLYFGCFLGALMGSILLQRFGSYSGLFRFSLIIIFLLNLIIFLWFKPKNNLKGQLKENPTKIKMKFANLKHKTTVKVFLLIDCINSFIGALFLYLPTLAYLTGLEIVYIFDSFWIGYIIVAVLSLVLTLSTPKSKKKLIYLMDLGFDVIPLSLMFFAQKHPIFMIISIVLLLLRDFVKPISLDYIYTLFDDDEIEYIWGILGTVPSIIGLIFIAFMPSLILWSLNFTILISIIFAVAVTLIAAKFLPDLKVSK